MHAFPALFAAPVIPQRFRRDPRVARPRAFTLLELLVSMTVAILLIVLLLQVFSTSTTNWQHGETRTDAYREARAALQIMGRDLSQTISPAATPAPTTAFPTPTPAPTSFSASLPVLVLQRSPESSAPNNAFEEAYCLTAIPNNGGASDVCAVGYYCKWDPVKHAFVLMRQFANSDATYVNIIHASQQTPLSFLSLFSRTAYGMTTTDVASYVWDLEVRIDTSLKAPAAMADAPAPPQANYVPTPTPLRYYGADPPYPDHLPSFVEIRFKAMSTGAAQVLENNPSITQAVWEDPTNAYYQRFILPSAQQFTVRLPMLNYDAATAPTPTPSS